jgi:putative transposase
MDVKRPRFSDEEKLLVLEEAKKNGVQVTLEKFKVYPATYYSWKQKYAEMGKQGFGHGVTREHLKEIKHLRKENSILKKLLAEKELEVHLQFEMTKKKYPEVYRKS